MRRALAHLGWLVLSYVPFAAIVCLVGAIVIGSVAYINARNYRPVSMGPIEVTTPIVTAGSVLTYTNGVCVAGSDPVAVDVTRGFTDESGTKDSVLTPDEHAVALPAFALLPGCQFKQPLRFQVPDDLAPGPWRLYVVLTAHGRHANETQRVTVVSNIFQVVPAQ